MAIPVGGSPASPILNPKSEVGHGIEKPCRVPMVVGRVTPCAPRLQPECTKYPRRRLPNPLPINAFSMFPRHNLGIGLKTRPQIRP